MGFKTKNLPYTRHHPMLDLIFGSQATPYMTTEHLLIASHQHTGL